MSDEDRLEDRLKEIILDYLDVEDKDVAAETPLDSLMMDSLDLLDVAVQIEDEFEVELDEEDLLQAETFGELIDRIMEVVVRWS